METKKDKKRYARRILLGVVLLPLLVVVLLTLFFACAPVQRFINSHASAYLTEKFGTEVRISHFFFNVFSRRIAVEGILMRDSEGDTLLHLGKLRAKVVFFNIGGNTYDLDELSIDSLTVKLYALNDSTFNYSFLSSGKDEEEDEPDEDSEPAVYDIQVAKLKLCNANYIYSTSILN